MKCVHVGICLKEETLENIFPLPLFPLNKMLARQAETDTKLQNKGFHNDEYKMKGFCFWNYHKYNYVLISLSESSSLDVADGWSHFSSQRAHLQSNI